MGVTAITRVSAFQVLRAKTAIQASLAAFTMVVVVEVVEAAAAVVPQVE